MTVQEREREQAQVPVSAQEPAPVPGERPPKHSGQCLSCAESRRHEPSSGRRGLSPRLRGYLWKFPNERRTLRGRVPANVSKLVPLFLPIRVHGFALPLSSDVPSHICVSTACPHFPISCSASVISVGRTCCNARREPAEAFRPCSRPSTTRVREPPPAMRGSFPRMPRDPICT